MKKTTFISIILSLLVNVFFLFVASYCLAESFRINPLNYESRMSSYDIDITIPKLPIKIRKWHFVLVDSQGNKKYFAVPGKEKKYKITNLKTETGYVLMEIIYTDDGEEILNSSAAYFYSIGNIIFFKQIFSLTTDTNKKQEPAKKKTRKIPI